VSGCLKIEDTELMTKKMSRKSKEDYLELMRGRYSRLTGRRAKSVLVSEFCEVTGHERKYALKLLNGRRCGRGVGRGGRAPSYGEAEEKVLYDIWRCAEMPCGKRLVAMLPEWLAWYTSRFEDPGEEVLKRVSGVSAATADRLLSKRKVSSGRRRGMPPKNSAVKAAVEVRAESWDAKESGWLEADTVALCGGCMAGDFMWAVSATDILSGWTEVRGIWNCGAAATCEGLRDIEETLPFGMKGIDTDNGSEFLNWHLVKHYAKRDVKVKQTRSRPYRKNDQAHIEQKNYTHVRQLLGYGRYGHAELVESVDGLLKTWSLWKNLYHPTMRQVECRREGGRRIRRHEKKARTPLQRLIDAGQLKGAERKALERMRREMNPFEMCETIENWLKWIVEKSSKLDAAVAKGKSGAALTRLVGRCPWLRSAQPETAPSSPRQRGKGGRNPKPRKDDASVSSNMRQPT